MTLLAAGGLICEGDPGSRRALTAILRRRGFSILATVESADELLRIASELPAGIIVLELALAGLAGLQIIPALRAVAPGCSVVLLSSFANLRSAAIAAGAYDLVDPCDLRDLEGCLDRLMAERRPTADSSPPRATNLTRHAASEGAY